MAFAWQLAEKLGDHQAVIPKSGTYPSHQQMLPLQASLVEAGPSLAGPMTVVAEGAGCELREAEQVKVVG